jgi:translation initiation factor IF-2
VDDPNYIQDLKSTFPKSAKILGISAETGEGLEELLQKIDKTFFKIKK